MVADTRPVGCCAPESVVSGSGRIGPSAAKASSKVISRGRLLPESPRIQNGLALVGAVDGRTVRAKYMMVYRIKFGMVDRRLPVLRTREILMGFLSDVGAIIDRLMARSPYGIPL